MLYKRRKKYRIEITLKEAIGVLSGTLANECNRTNTKGKRRKIIKNCNLNKNVTFTGQFTFYADNHTPSKRGIPNKLC